ncbi:MAG: hypothetical protein ACUVQG_08760 [Thermogutta sp.]
MTDLKIDIPARGLFHFAVPCYFQKPLWGEGGALLSERHRLPNLAQVDKSTSWVEAYAGWNDDGFALRFRVYDKETPRLLAATGRGASIFVWINTRAAQDIHRATHYCHWFEIRPTKGRKGELTGKVLWRAIPKARDVPISPPLQSIQAHVDIQPNMQDYTVDLLFSREALTGYYPREHRRIGLNFEIEGVTREALTFSAGFPLPYREDPSLWVTLDLVEA